MKSALASESSNILQIVLTHVRNDCGYPYLKIQFENNNFNEIFPGDINDLISLALLIYTSVFQEQVNDTSHNILLHIISAIYTEVYCLNHNT